MRSEFTSFNPPIAHRPIPQNSPFWGFTSQRNAQISLWIDDYRPQYLSSSVYDRERYELQRTRGCPKNKKQVQKCVGMIRAIWYNKNEQVSCHTQGTGFLVGSRILMASAATIYSNRLRRFADKLLFLPDISYGRFRDQSGDMRALFNLRIGQSVFTINNKIIQGSYLRPALDHGKVRKEMLCLVVLPEDNPFYYKQYITIGELPDLQPHKPQQLIIMGYQDKGTHHNHQAKRSVQRVEIYCQMEGIEQAYEMVTNCKQNTTKQPYRTVPTLQVIRHTGEAEFGMTGSPILAMNSSSKLYAVGMQGQVAHSSISNFGVYFHEAVLHAIQDLELQIQYTRYIQRGIKYFFFRKKLSIFEIEQQSEPQKSLVEANQKSLNLCQLQRQKQQGYRNKACKRDKDEGSNSSEVSDMECIEDLLGYFTIKLPQQEPNIQ